MCFTISHGKDIFLVPLLDLNEEKNGQWLSRSFRFRFEYCKSFWDGLAIHCLGSLTDSEACFCLDRSMLDLKTSTEFLISRVSASNVAQENDTRGVFLGMFSLRRLSSEFSFSHRLVITKTQIFRLLNYFICANNLHELL